MTCGRTREASPSIALTLHEHRAMELPFRHAIVIAYPAPFCLNTGDEAPKALTRAGRSTALVMIDGVTAR